MGGKSSASGKRIRKDNDSIELVPLSRMNSSGGGSGTNKSDEKLQPVCTLSFETELPQEKSLLAGTPLLLKEEDGIWKITHQGKVIANLKRARSAMLKHCLEEGYHYKGKVKVKEDTKYGEFRRSS